MYKFNTCARLTSLKLALLQELGDFRLAVSLCAFVSTDAPEARRYHTLTRPTNLNYNVLRQLVDLNLLVLDNAQCLLQVLLQLCDVALNLP